jgi:hypothetical protein
LALPAKSQSKKVSILVCEDFEIPSGSSLFSEEDLVSLSDLNLSSQKVLSAELLESYF